VYRFFLVLNAGEKFYLLTLLEKGFILKKEPQKIARDPAGRKTH
jgi:hypothetical protein